jgi:phosphatidylglycerophosphate synthase
MEAQKKTIEYPKNEIITLPNIITFIGIFAGVMSMVLYFEGLYFSSFCCFCGAVLTDFLDGWFARKLDWTSELGKILDPIRDKFLVLVLVVIFSWVLGFAILFELLSLRFSLPLRKKKGEHVIATGSKVATAIQFFAGISLFLTFYVSDSGYSLILLCGLVGVICICSFFRIIIYQRQYSKL